MLRIKELQSLLAKEMEGSSEHLRNILLATPEGGILAYAERPSHLLAPELINGSSKTGCEFCSIPETYHERMQTIVASLVNLYFCYTAVYQHLRSYVIDYSRGRACVGEVFYGDCVLCIWAKEDASTGLLLQVYERLSQLLCNLIISDPNSANDFPVES